MDTSRIRDTLVERRSALDAELRELTAVPRDPAAAVSFGKRIPDMPLYTLFLIPLVAVFALRMLSMAAKAAPRPVQAG